MGLRMIYKSIPKQNLKTSTHPAEAGQPEKWEKKCCPLSAALIPPHAGAETHNLTRDGGGGEKHAHVLILSSEVLFPVFLFHQRQRKHNGQTVLKGCAGGQAVCGGSVGAGGGSVTYIWKGMEVNTEGTQRGCECDHRGLHRHLANSYIH